MATADLRFKASKCSSPQNNVSAEKTAPTQHDSVASRFQHHCGPLWTASLHVGVGNNMQTQHGWQQLITPSLASRRKQLKSMWRFSRVSTLSRNAAHTEEDCDSMGEVSPPLCQKPLALCCKASPTSNVNGSSSRCYWVSVCSRQLPVNC